MVTAATLLHSNTKIFIILFESFFFLCVSMSKKCLQLFWIFIYLILDVSCKSLCRQSQDYNSISKISNFQINRMWRHFTVLISPCKQSYVYFLSFRWCIFLMDSCLVLTLSQFGKVRYLVTLSLSL